VLTSLLLVSTFAFSLFSIAFSFFLFGFLVQATQNELVKSLLPLQKNQLENAPRLEQSLTFPKKLPLQNQNRQSLQRQSKL
jgi:hypothetical protein